MKTLWKNKKYRPSRLWKAGYERNLKGERFLVMRLQGKLPKNVENIERVYESMAAAKNDGWTKVYITKTDGLYL